MPYPKIVFLYPTFLAAIFAGIYMAIAHNEMRQDTVIVSGVFLAIFAMNMLVFSFDFPRTTSLTLAAAIVAIIFGFILLLRSYPLFGGWLQSVLIAYHPHANATFYFSLAAVLAVIYIFVFVGVQFDYWEVTPNELLHHHGFLSDLKRFPSNNMRVEKEINDVFENLLLGAGRLILHPPGEQRTIVLENVMMINRKEARVTRLLSALKVQIDR